MSEECGDLRFFQPPLINDRKRFSPPLCQKIFHIRFQKDIVFPEQENKSISIQNTSLRLHLPQLNF